MSIRTTIKLLLAAVTCLLLGVARAGDVTSEVEPNDPITAPEQLSVPSEVSVPAFLGNNGADDLDYYTFYANAGDVVTIDIDNGVGGTQSVDTMIAVFDSGPNHDILRFDDDAPTLDPGSTSTLDSRIDDFVVPTTGYYIVGVSNYPRYFTNGGAVINTAYARHGDYTLVISGVTNPIKQIAIEIKPGSKDIAPVNPNSRGKIPVAILGGPDFNALAVDPKTLTFGSTGHEHSLAKCNWTGADVNRDGRVDLICHFYTQAAQFKPTDAEAKIHGKTMDGVEFEGTGFLKVVPAKGHY